MNTCSSPERRGWSAGQPSSALRGPVPHHRHFAALSVTPQPACAGTDEYIGRSWQFLDYMFTKRVPMPNLVSTVAITRAGFGEAMYCDEMLAKWFARYQADGLLPPS